MQQLYLHQSDNSFVYVCLFYVVMFQGPAQLSIACSMHMDGAWEWSYLCPWAPTIYVLGFV